jgi:hypothetical protein
MITTTFAAMFLASSLQAMDCNQAQNTTLELSNQLQEIAREALADDYISALEVKKIVRRIDSVRISLINLRAYCHHDAAMLNIANNIEDVIDTYEASLR